MELSKMFFISLQKLFSFSRKLKFRISDIQISWQHQMPKHKKEMHFTEYLGKKTQYIKEIRPAHTLQNRKNHQKILKKLRSKN